MNAEAGQLISKLGLAPLPREGGFFAPTWTSQATLPGGRPCASTILFLMTETDFSALHRLRMDEVWHFHAGDSADLALLDPNSGVCRGIVLGPDVTTGGNAPQALVPAGTWQGARLRTDIRAPRGWALFSCTVSPAWDEREFELGLRPELLREFPAHASVITALTR
jgi:predicted cupin superfamily sugar epimerase